jgi:hypothetical protein
MDGNLVEQTFTVTVLDKPSPDLWWEIWNVLERHFEVVDVKPSVGTKPESH